MLERYSAHAMAPATIPLSCMNDALLKRLDKAIGRYYETDETTDEINPS